MYIYIKKVNEDFKRIRVKNDLEELQKLIGGYIESITINTDPKIVVLCDEEGRLKNLPYNISVHGVKFVGTILIVGVNGDEFTDIPKGMVPLTFVEKSFEIKL